MNYSNTGRPEEFSIRLWHNIYAIRFKLSGLLGYTSELMLR